MEMIHTVTGLIGTEDELVSYVDEIKRDGNTSYVLFVSDDMIPDNTSCYQYIKDFCDTSRLFESEDTLLGLLEFAEIEEHFIYTHTVLPLEIKRRLMLLQAFLVQNRKCIICGLFEEVDDADVAILNNMLMELSTWKDITLGYSFYPKNSLCDNFIYLSNDRKT